jgi:hypothetical protein
VLGAPLQYWQSLMKTLFDAYRPELHYMPGLAQNGARSIRTDLNKSSGSVRFC